MHTETVLELNDIATLLATLYQRNKRGPIVALQFYDANAQPLPVAMLKVFSDEPGLDLNPQQDESAGILDALYHKATGK